MSLSRKQKLRYVVRRNLDVQEFGETVGEVLVLVEP